MVRARREGATIAVYPLSIAEPDPVLAVDPDGGPTLLGPELELRRHDDEDPVAFTVRALEDMVAEANALAAGRAADSARLDRIAAFLNRPGQWNGGDSAGSSRRRSSRAAAVCSTSTGSHRASREPAPPNLARSARGRAAPAPASGGGPSKKESHDEHDQVDDP